MTTKTPAHPAWCDGLHRPSEAHGGGDAEIAGVTLARTLSPHDGLDLVALTTFVSDTQVLLTVADRRALIAYLNSTLPEAHPAHTTPTCHSATASAGAR